MAALTGKKVVILLENLYNDLEFWYPKLRLAEAGAQVLVAGPKAKAQYTSKYGLPATADIGFKEALGMDFDAVIVPGGYAPDLIRRSPEAVELVAKVFGQGRLVAHICHAGWVTASAGVLKGRTCTSYFSIKDDVVNAGARWVDQEVVVDGNLITSRTPDDLPAWLAAIIDFMAK